MAIQLFTQDNYSITDAPISVNKLDEFYSKSLVKDAESKDSNILKLVLDATRSGSIVNRRTYRAESVERKHKRFITPNMKPVLKNHASEDVDATIGRVMDATFERLAATDEQFYNDFKYAKKGNQGSGRVMLDIGITDLEAQQKVLDQRYMTVSTGQRLSKAVCSHCSKDWMDGYCKHFPGEKCDLEESSPLVKAKLFKAGDKVEAFLIADIDDYDEVSFVNVPAQSFAKVTKIKDSCAAWSMTDNDMSRFCGVLISGTFTRSKDCVYDVCMQDANGFTHGLLLDDYRDHIRQTVTGKTTVDMRLPAGNVQQDLSDNKGSEEPVANNDKATEFVADNKNNKSTNSEKNAMVDPKVTTEAPNDAANLLARTNDELAAKLKVSDAALEASKAHADALVKEKNLLLQATIDSQAKMLLTMRKVSGHSDTVSLDAEKETAYLNTLKTRSIESLKDSIADESAAFYKAITALKEDQTKLAAQPIVGSPADAKPDAKKKTADTKKVNAKHDVL